jgi:uncharacterized protein YbjT (DUF2867 family)
MKSSVCIAGATGFTGSFVVEQFIESNRYTISLFVRNPEKIEPSYRHSIQEIETGDFDRIETLKRALSGKELFVCCASLGFGHAPAIVRACEEAGVRRAVFISTTAIFTRLNPATKQVRLDAEEAIRKSSLHYTILRPTMIYGAPGDRNIERLIKYISRYPVLPVAGPGTYEIQPVYVGDVAWAAVHAGASENTINKTYTISGRDVLSYNDLVRLVARLLGKRILLVHIPLGVMSTALRIYERCVPHPRLKAEQLLRLNEDKDFEYTEAARDMGYNPQGVEQTIAGQLDKLGYH